MMLNIALVRECPSITAFRGFTGVTGSFGAYARTAR
jgi:hypothetical protein